MYLEYMRFGIKDVYNWIHRQYELSPYSISQPSLLDPSNTTMPNLIVLVSCDSNPHTFETVLDYYFEYGPKDQTLVCLMHEIGNFWYVDGPIRRWAHAGRLRFMALSSHTAHTLREHASNFGEIYKGVRIDVFPPVFPAPFDSTPPPINISFAIQGNVDHVRRDYFKTFLDLERIIDKLPESIVSRIQLVLVGDGGLEIPTKVTPYVSLNFALDYIPYYKLLHQSFALIPAFGNEEYYTMKASSSVPASFIANSAIVADHRLLETYGYLTAESTWPMKSEAENEMNAIYEILTQYFDDNGTEKSSWKSVVEEKRRAVRERSLELMERNARLMWDIIRKEDS